MGNKRAALDLTETVDIEELAGQRPDKSKNVDRAKIEEVAEQSGFTSRQPHKIRRRRKKSPFTEQQAIRVRPGMRELFQDVGEHLDVLDHTTFEKAMLALIEKEGTEELLQRYKELTK